MQQIKSHPYIDRRTVKAWVTSSGTFIQIVDIRDIYHGFYAVESNICAGGLSSVFESWSLDKCERWVQENADNY